VGSVDIDQVHATVLYSTIDGKRGTQRQIVSTNLLMSVS
jgi:hypothetical protein